MSRSSRLSAHGTRVAFSGLMHKLAVALGVLGASSAIQAAVITETLSTSGSNQWTADFTVTNDGSMTPLIESFTIYFGPDAYSLSVPFQAKGWDLLVAQPDSGLGVTGFADALNTDPNFAFGVGDTQGGFTVDFLWAGPAAPVAGLNFTINNPNDFSVLGSGVTVPAVPEPSSAALLALGGLGLWLSRRGRQAASTQS